VSIKFVEKEKSKQKGGYEYRTEYKTRSARNTGRTTGREESIHTRHRLIESGKQTRNVREGESAKVGNSHSGIETSPPSYDACSYLVTPLRGILRKGQV